METLPVVGQGAWGDRLNAVLIELQSQVVALNHRGDAIDLRADIYATLLEKWLSADSAASAAAAPRPC